MPPTKKPDENDVTLALRWVENEQLDTVYANHVFVSHAGPEFLVVFGRAESPLVIFGDDAVVDLPDFVPIKPVAKLVFSPQAMVVILEAIQKNVQTFIQKGSQDTNDDADDQ